MDEQGFDFRPKEKRDPKRFVPPPWEQDAFERLERERAKGGSSSQVKDQEVLLGAESQVAGQKTDPVGADGVARRAEQKDPSSHVKLNEGAVLEMLAGLAAEDPPATKDYLGVAIGASLVLIALGGMLLIWGMAALVGARQTGWMGQVSGAGLGIFGAFFLGMGVWLMYRTLKQRGVL